MSPNLETKSIVCSFTSIASAGQISIMNAALTHGKGDLDDGVSIVSDEWCGTKRDQMSFQGQQGQPTATIETLRSNNLSLKLP